MLTYLIFSQECVESTSNRIKADFFSYHETVSNQARVHQNTINHISQSIEAETSNIRSEPFNDEKKNYQTKRADQLNCSGLKQRRLKGCPSMMDDDNFVRLFKT